MLHNPVLSYLVTCLIWRANCPSWPNSINSCPGKKDLTLNSSPSPTSPASQPSFILHKCFYFLSSNTEEGWAYMPPPPWHWVSLIGLQEAQAFFHHYWLFWRAFYPYLTLLSMKINWNWRRNVSVFSPSTYNVFKGWNLDLTLLTKLFYPEYLLLPKGPLLQELPPLQACHGSSMTIWATWPWAPGHTWLG